MEIERQWICQKPRDEHERKPSWQQRRRFTGLAFCDVAILGSAMSRHQALKTWSGTTGDRRSGGARHFDS